MSPLKTQHLSFQSTSQNYRSHVLNVHILFKISTTSKFIVLPWDLRCHRLSGTYIMEDFRLWNLQHTHHAGGNGIIDDTHMVLVETHAQEFTDHLNTIDDDIKSRTEGEGTTHTVSNEEVNISTRTEREQAFLDTWPVINGDGSIKAQVYRITRPIRTSTYTLIAITY